MGLDMAMENNLTRRTVLGLFASIPLYLSSAHYAKAETAEINTTVNPVVPFTKENAVLASLNLARSFGKENIDAVNPLLYRIVKQDDINLLEDILDDYTISASYLFSTFDVTYMKTWDSYYGIDQWDFVAECGRYACAVTACYVLLGFLVNYYSPDGRVNKSVYDQL